MARPRLIALGYAQVMGLRTKNGLAAEGKAMFEKLVVPLDGSDLAEAVLPIATELAKGLGATMILVQAIDAMGQRVSASSSMDPAGGGVGAEAIEEAIDAEKGAAAQYLERMQAQLTAQGLACESYVGDGRPADVIIETAKEKGATLIVMTTHGRGGLGRLIYGGVSEHLLHHSTVPILIVRSSDNHKKH